MTNFEIAQNFLCYFLCYFLKNSKFGRTPEFREQVTALGDMTAELTMSERQSSVSASVRASSWAILTSLDMEWW